MYAKYVYVIPVIFIACGLAFAFFCPLVSAQTIGNTDMLDTGRETRVAPGELLPIAITLTNFGEGEKVGVGIRYEIINSKNVLIYMITDIVEVQTTTHFIKTLPVSSLALPGEYVAKTSIIYQGQLVPATSQFNFIVENRIFGLFQSDFYLYVGVAILLSILLIFLGYLLVIFFKATHITLLDYSRLSYDERVFFELLSDVIMRMRLKVGDGAIDVAVCINGLTIDQKTGRVLKITDDPSKIIASLVSGYEKVFGKKISFEFRK